MKREFQVRFWERLGVKFPWATRQHRLFCQVTQTWRGKPLVSRETVVELIAAATTRSGLLVRCALDTRDYPKGIKVSDQEMDEDARQAAQSVLPHRMKGQDLSGNEMTRVVDSHRLLATLR